MAVNLPICPLDLAAPPTVNPSSGTRRAMTFGVRELRRTVLCRKFAFGGENVGDGVGGCEEREEREERSEGRTHCGVCGQKDLSNSA